MLDLSFYHMGVHISVKTTKNVTLLVDESATGKTLLMNILMMHFSQNIPISRMTYETMGYGAEGMHRLLNGSGHIILMDDAEFYIDEFIDELRSTKQDVIVALKNAGHVGFDKNIGLGYVVNTREEIRLEEGRYNCNIRR